MDQEPRPSRLSANEAQGFQVRLRIIEGMRHAGQKVHLGGGVGPDDAEIPVKPTGCRAQSSTSTPCRMPAAPA